jgi:xylulokinase
MKDAVLGIDAGTSSIKCSLFDLKGVELFSLSKQYELLNPRPEIFEIDSEVLWLSVVKAIKEIIDENRRRYEIISIGLCAMMIMPVFLDKRNKVLRPIIHWFDGRLQKQYFETKKTGMDKVISKYSGSGLTGESTVNTIEWIKKNEPETYKKTAKFFMIKDFIRFKLTGGILTDYGDASGTQMLDTKKWKWSDEVITEFDFNRAIFPDLLKPCDIGGYITKDVSIQTGLKEGIPVAVGSGDGITTIFGLGIYKDGQVGITVGSAGVIAASTTHFPEDKKRRTYVFCHPFCDRWFSLMATASSGEILRWYCDSIIKNNNIKFSDLDTEAAASPAGSDGILFLPYLLGSRNPYSNPKASGVFLGLKYRHNRSNLTRAVLEGISFELMDILKTEEEILSKNNLHTSEIKLSGGITKSSFWMQMLADIMQKDLVTTKVKELGALGSAVIASVALGVYGNLEQALGSMVKDDRIVNCNKSLSEIYDKKFGLFREMYQVLEPKFDLFSD